MGFEPTALCLGSRCSATELLPLTQLRLNFTVNKMKNQGVDNILLQSLVSTTSLESLVKGYILNCRTEGKSPKTIPGYEMVLRNFTWYCKQQRFPELFSIL